MKVPKRVIFLSELEAEFQIHRKLRNKTLRCSYSGGGRGRSGYIHSWNIQGRAVKNIFLGRKAMTNLESILKSRAITLPTKVHIVKAMIFQ